MKCTEGSRSIRWKLKRGELKENRIATTIGNALQVCILLALFLDVIIIFDYESLYARVCERYGKIAKSELQAPYHLSLLDATELHLEESSSIDMIDKFPLHRYLIRIMLKALTLRIPQSSVGVVAPGERVLIAHTATSDEFHIEMPEIVSLEGHWWAERAQVRSAGGVDRNQGKPGNTEETWGSSLTDNYESATPYFNASLPLDQVDLNEDMEKRVISVTAVMEVIYPIPSSSYQFEDRHKRLSHGFEILVLNEDELTDYKAVRQRYRQARCPSIVRKGIGFPLTLVGVPLLLFLLLNWKYKLEILIPIEK